MNKFVNFSANVKNAFENNEEMYMGFSQLLKDYAEGVFEGGVTKSAADKMIKERFASIVGVSENASAKEVRRALQRNRQDIYEVIEDIVPDLLTTGWANNEFFQQFVEIRNLALGDANEFIVEDNHTVLSVGKLSGDHWDIDRQRLGQGETFRVNTGWIGLGIYAEFEKLIMGREDWGKLVQAIYKALDEYIMGLVYESVMSAGAQVLPGSNQFYKTAALNAAAKDTFLEMIEDVQAVNRGSEVVIMGTKTALSKLNALEDIQWLSDSAKEERHTLGRLGIFEGVRLVELPQVFAKNDTTTKLVDPNVLLIMPLADNKFVKLVYEGQSMVKEVPGGELHDWTQEMKYLEKIGVSTLIGRYFGTWNIVA